MQAAETCPDCGAPIPVDSPFGGCPACLMQSAVEGAQVGVRRPSSPVAAGTRIGHYRLIGKLGEGGFGEVYEAEQEQPVTRRVALKLLKRGMDTRQVVARFEAERQALALMDHPNVATVYDAGESDDGRPFFVMELVDGRPVTDFCQEQKLDLRTRLELFIAVCEGVQHAHSKGLIHRDLKPSNVLVAIRDGKMVPKVIDFGVAKATDHILTPKTVYTELGRKVGTPVYMSPEQAAGKPDVDIRSDVYSLGALLYELLTGHTPFDLERLRHGGQAELERILSEDTPPKPSTRITTLGADRRSAGRLRGDLDWIVMRALEKEPDRRYPTALGLANDVRRHLACKAVEAGPPSRIYQMGRFARRNKALLGAVIGIFAALVAGTIVSTWQAIRATRAETEASRQAERAILAEREARSEATVGDSLTSFLTDNVVAAAFEGGIPDNLLKIMAVMHRAEQHLAKLDHQPLVQAGGYLIMGRIYFWAGQPEMAFPMTERSLALYRRELGPLHDKSLQALEDHLRVLLGLKSYSEVETELSEIMPRAEMELPTMHPRLVSLLHVQHDCYAQQDKQAERARILRRLLERDFMNANVWSDLRHAHLVLSQRAFDEGRHEDAIEEMVAASLFASVYNRGAFWHDSLILTMGYRRQYIEAGITPEGADWNDFVQVLNPIALDTLASRFALPAPAEAMTRAYLQYLRGDLGGAVETIRPLAERHPDLHVLQNAYGRYLEESGASQAVDAYRDAAHLAASEDARTALYWYAANWSRTRHRHAFPLQARELPRSGVIRDPETGHVYQRLEIPLAWQDARDACKALGGNLAVVNSEEENELLYSRFATAHSCWLGASLPAEEREWTWIDGSRLGYSNWTSRQPPEPGKTPEEGFGVAFGDTGPFTIFQHKYDGVDSGSAWFARNQNGLVWSPDWDDTLHNALFLFALCEWDSEKAWKESLRESGARGTR